MTSRRTCRAVATMISMAALVLAIWTSTRTFVPEPQVVRPAVNAALAPTQVASAAAVLMPMFAEVPPAAAGEPPSVGDHWYWNLGFGSLHGETASIILLVFFLYVVFALLGAGGSSKRNA
mmetsp:Transcript_34221/g.67370  ORF Transcript_34221/g.67370 Transcript_34221/m.67370 type:complete len:120 (+) Transcript_34221:61-420(+)